MVLSRRRRAYFGTRVVTSASGSNGHSELNPKHLSVFAHHLHWDMLQVVRFLVYTLSIRCGASRCALLIAARIFGLATLTLHRRESVARTRGCDCPEPLRRQ